MAIHVMKTDLDGVLIIEPQIFADARGYFFESYNKSEFAKHGITAEFIQDNQSKSSYGVIRGLHCQWGDAAQAKLVRVLSGKVLDVAVDIRPGSSTFGKHIAVELSDENQRQLFIPRGFLHGFAVLSETAVFAYKVDNPYCKEAEFGIRYDDATVGVNWKVPPEKVLISDKDKLLGNFSDILRREHVVNCRS